MKQIIIQYATESGKFQLTKYNSRHRISTKYETRRGYNFKEREEIFLRIS